jgi:predicted P-loop ATPase
MESSRCSFSTGTHELPLMPNANHAGAGPFPRPINDDDVTQLQEWLQWNGMPSIGQEITHQAVNRRAKEFPYHRLREWLNGLEWDGTPRIGSWLTTYLGASASEYHNAIGRMFLIAMVARVFQPGCKADYVIIFQGTQGEEKSKVCEVLAGREYFSDQIPDIHSKDVSQHVRGLWLVELPELSALSRADIEAWKAFITRTVERFRPTYGRRETIEPRQCLFVGTTNKGEYLRDETGNRRFWPVRIGVIDLEALARDRDQLFAEATDRFNHDEHWWPDRSFEAAHIAPQQEAAFEVDVWEPVIAKWLDLRVENKVLVSEVGTGALDFKAVAQIPA